MGHRNNRKRRGAGDRNDRATLRLRMEILRVQTFYAAFPEGNYRGSAAIYREPHLLNVRAWG